MPWPTSLGVGQASLADARPSSTDPPARLAVPPFETLIQVALILFIAPLGVLGSGCTKKNDARADSPEVRLTTGGGIKIYPRFSPDGSTLAYSLEMSPDDPGPAVYVVPTAGGEPRRVSVKGAKEYAIDWAPDGKGIFVHSSEGKYLRRIALDGTALDTIPNPEIRYCEAATPDGRAFLAFQLHGDNMDLGILSAEGKLDLLTETPEWEIYGAFGPKPGEVTFIRYAAYGATVGEIFVWSPSTRVATPLPLPRARQATPTWSPDGASMAYCSDVSGNMDLWVYQTANGRTTQLTSTPEEEKSPHWSRDGELVAFSRQAQTSHIFVGDPKTAEKRQVTEGPDLDLNVTASKDGSWVAFVRQLRGGEGAMRPALCLIPAAGGEVTSLDLSDLTLNTERRAVAWSADGSQIAFAADDGTGNVDIYRVRRAGGTPTRVTIESGMDIQPAWSPNGESIAYVRRAGGNTQIWVIPATGGVPRQVTRNAGMNEGAVWAPDSDHLSYYSVTGEMTYELWTTSARDPKSARRLREAEEVAWPMRWSKDGSRVLVMRKEGDGYALWTVSAADGSLETKLLTEGGEGAPKNFPVFTPAGMAYYDVVFPGGIHAFTDGENVADVFLLRVNDVLQERLRGNAGPSS